MQCWRQVPFLVGPCGGHGSAGSTCGWLPRNLRWVRGVGNSGLPNHGEAGTSQRETHLPQFPRSCSESVGKHFSFPLGNYRFTNWAKLAIGPWAIPTVMWGCSSCQAFQCHDRIISSESQCKILFQQFTLVVCNGICSDPQCVTSWHVIWRKTKHQYWVWTATYYVQQWDITMKLYTIHRETLIRILLLLRLGLLQHPRAVRRPDMYTYI